ncbi:uncharacterized protein At2g29880-like [Prunus avium]|uniref:Uncharacterized protein At2g29880-like n=1 Tax=Prunus avium TaxID=42229 RepID=A0A6P5U1V8_PRUAV|nr:uncharacterized protein At2g29880-like [Prunus avium]
MKSHPSHKNLQIESVANYDDLKIVVGGATATGNGSLALGVDDTDATTFRDEENLNFGMEDFTYDAANETFVAPSHYQPSFQPSSPYQSTPPIESPLGFEVPQGKTSQKKRSRSEYEGSSNSIDSTNQAKEKVLETISTNFEKIYALMEKRERDRERDRENGIWDAMKDVPNLDDNVRYKAVELLNTKVKQDMFLKMSPEERSSWISFKLG